MTRRNAPEDERLGFRPIDKSQLGSLLAALRGHGRERGLDSWLRLAVFRPL